MEENKKELVDFAVTARKYKTYLTKKFINRTVYVAPNHDEIKSYIPGTVITVKVKVGQKVKEGETILIQEAMKMMNQIKMPRTGKIKEILVTEGQRIRKGDIMIVIES
jgi:biotin carboxyl carrier protein